MQVGVPVPRQGAGDVALLVGGGVLVDLGLVYDVDITDGHVHVAYTLTTMGCPIGPLIEAQMHQLLDPLPGVDSFDAEMVLRPPWSPEMMSEEAKEALGYF